MSVQHVNPEGLLTLPEYTQVVVSPPGRLAFIAGQGAFDRDFNLIGAGDLHAQTVQAFANLRTALAGVGATPADVVSSTLFIVDLDEAKTAIFVAAMKVALDGKPFPPNASTLVGVTRLAHPHMLIEINAVAALP